MADPLRSSAAGLPLPRCAAVPDGVHPAQLSPPYRSTVGRAPSQPLVALPQRLTEVTGPLLGDGRVTQRDADLTAQADVEPIGQRIVVQGSVRDSDGRPVLNTLVEAGRPTPAVATGTPSTPGRHRSTPRGFGRSETVLGEYAVLTLKPGRVLDGEGGLQAPHVDVSVFARGLLDRVVTRCYSGDEAAANEEDPVLQSLPEAARRTLIAEPTDDRYRLDVVLQGADETTSSRV